MRELMWERLSASVEATPTDHHGDPTPRATVRNLDRLRTAGPARPFLFEEEWLDKGPLEDEELFDADGNYLGTIEHTFDEGWYCD